MTWLLYKRHPDFYDARREHAWLLRAEGMELKTIGLRLGVSIERVRQLIRLFGLKTNRTLKRRRTKFIVHAEH
jgi:hypothetical protein